MVSCRRDGQLAEAKGLDTELLGTLRHEAGCQPVQVKKHFHSRSKQTQIFIKTLANGTVHCSVPKD
jgi:hypothetical protein